jgi:hypothetical protein
VPQDRIDDMLTILRGKAKLRYVVDQRKKQQTI